MHQILRYSNIKFQCPQKVMRLEFTLYTIQNYSQNRTITSVRASKYILKHNVNFGALKNSCSDCHFRLYIE